MARRTTTGINVGGSSILVIFIILCLTTFATLSMVSAGADLRLSEKAATAAREYYAADAEAERLLAEIDRALPADSTAEAGKTAIESALPEVFVTVESDDALIARYAVPIGETQELQVTLRLLPKARKDARLERRAWQVVPTGEWEPESEGFTLWGGEGDVVLSDSPPLPQE